MVSMCFLHPKPASCPAKDSVKQVSLASGLTSAGEILLLCQPGSQRLPQNGCTGPAQGLRGPMEVHGLYRCQPARGNLRAALKRVHPTAASGPRDRCFHSVYDNAPVERSKFEVLIVEGVTASRSSRFAFAAAVCCPRISVRVSNT